jgi:hypothetical protein
MRLRKFFGSLLIAFGAVAATSVAAEPVLSPADAAKHVGEHANVCGLVVSAKFATHARGAPTFLNLDQPYPQQVFTAVIWAEDRDKFSPRPESLKGSTICVSGLVSDHQGVAEITVRDPRQIGAFNPPSGQ